MGYDYDQLFPGRFLKSGEFKGKEVTLTVAGVRLEELPEEKGGNRTRGILAFRETKKELVLNRTNGECIKGMFGRQTDDWIGKRITFYPATISAFGDDQTTAIRVRGSPDIERDMPIEVRLPRKKPVRATMKKTRGAVKAAAPAPPPVPPPEADPTTGEVPFNDSEGPASDGLPY